MHIPESNSMVSLGGHMMMGSMVSGGGTFGLKSEGEMANKRMNVNSKMLVSKNRFMR